MDEASGHTEGLECGGNAGHGGVPFGAGFARAGHPASLAVVNELANRAAAADDAWILCVVLLERLQSPMLAPGETAALLADLASRYGRFRQALQPIERLVAGGRAGA